ncbi:MAG: ATP-binding cassette domain-containing protein [Verrucomicrobiales bacterium]|nr:ATP-binding cassette domain-containing protein [Verrucomicrobiales bacterium]
MSGEIRAGEVILLRGEDGSGKTSLLNLLPGCLEPEAGSIEFLNLDSRILHQKIRNQESKVLYASPLGCRPQSLPAVHLRASCPARHWPHRAGCPTFRFPRPVQTASPSPAPSMPRPASSSSMPPSSRPAAANQTGCGPRATTAGQADDSADRVGSRTRRSCADCTAPLRWWNRNVATGHLRNLQPGRCRDRLHACNALHV